MNSDVGVFRLLQNRGSRSLIICAVVLFVATCIYLALRLPLGVPGEWISLYHEQPASLRAVLIVVLVLSVYLWAGFFFSRKVRTASVVTNGLTLLVLTPLYGLLLYVFACTGPYGRAEFIAPASQHGASGLFLLEANRIAPDAQYQSAVSYLDDFPAILKQYAKDYEGTVRVNNNPPGLTMLFLAARRAAESMPGLTDVAAEVTFGRGARPAHLTQAQTLLGVWTLLLGAALAFVPAFLVASIFAGRSRPAVAAVAMLAGSLLLFVPCKNSFEVQFFIWMQWFFLMSMRRKSVLFGLLYGAMAAAGFFFTLAIAVLVVAHALFSLWFVARQGREVGFGWLLFWVSSALGLAAGFLLLYATTGYNAPATLVQCYLNHRGFYATYHRTYWKWLIYSPWEYLLFMGAPLAAGVIWATVHLGRAIGKRPHGEIAFISIVSTTAIMALLIMLGKNMGEVNRLYIFFQPLLALPACAVIAGISKDNLAAGGQYDQPASSDKSASTAGLEGRGRGHTALLTIAVLQGVCIIVLQLFIDIWRSEGLFADIMKLVET